MRVQKYTNGIDGGIHREHNDMINRLLKQLDTAQSSCRDFKIISTRIEEPLLEHVGNFVVDYRAGQGTVHLGDRKKRFNYGEVENTCRNALSTLLELAKESYTSEYWFAEQREIFWDIVKEASFDVEKGRSFHVIFKKHPLTDKLNWELKCMSLTPTALVPTAWSVSEEIGKCDIMGKSELLKLLHSQSRYLDEQIDICIKPVLNWWR